MLVKKKKKPRALQIENRTDISGMCNEKPTHI